jgi:hypothetical protein
MYVGTYLNTHMHALQRLFNEYIHSSSQQFNVFQVGLQEGLEHPFAEVSKPLESIRLTKLKLGPMF